MGKRVSSEADRQAMLIAYTEPYRQLSARAPFDNRKLSARVVDALIKASIDAPERLLFMTTAELRAIPGVGKAGLAEIAKYRSKFIPETPKAALPMPDNKLSSKQELWLCQQCLEIAKKYATNEDEPVPIFLRRAVDANDQQAINVWKAWSGEVPVPDATPNIILAAIKAAEAAPVPPDATATD
jgi:hypothetical protein